MSTDYAQKEREFIDSLQVDTGCDLAGWMDRIAAQQLPHRNNIIDWLRGEGFIFAKASWLERIYHNGGAPIYPDPDEPPATTATGLAPPDRPKSEASTSNRDDSKSHPLGTSDPENGSAGALQNEEPQKRPSLRLVASNDASDKTDDTTNPPATPKTMPVRDSVPTTRTNDLDATLLAAKGLMPLARLIIDALKAARAEVSITADGSTVVAHVGSAPFAALVLQPKVLRLALNRSGLTSPPDFQSLNAPSGRLSAGKARIPAQMTHIHNIDDARQIDRDLTELVRETAEAAAETSE